MSYSYGRSMRDQNSTFMSAIERFQACYKENPDHFTKSDLNDLETLKRHTNQLLSAFYRGEMNNELHWDAFDQAQVLCKKLEKKYNDYEQKKKWAMGYSCQQKDKKFNSYHKPAGSPDGGQFDFSPENGGGGNSGGSPGSNSPSSGDRTQRPSWSERIWQETFGSKPAAADELPSSASAKRAATVATANVLDPQKYPYGNHQCAQYVREDLNKAGIPVTPPLSGQAKDYGPQLTKPDVGFQKITGTQHAGQDLPKDYKPEPGDVAVIQATSTSPAGHMAIYGPDDYWYSDHKQIQGFWPGKVYRAEKPTVKIYRHAE